MNKKPRVGELNKRFKTKRFFLTKEFNRHFVAIEKEYLSKRAINSLRKEYCVIPMKHNYYYIAEKD